MDKKIISGIVLDDDTMLSLEELSKAVHAEHDFIIEMVEHELIIPIGDSPDEWQFDSVCLRRSKIAISFYRDLDVNLEGISLALDLLDRVEALEKKIQTLNKFLGK